MTARPGAKRTAARVAAAQALYQIEMSGAPAADVIAEFRDHRLDDASDRELFAAIVATTSVRREEIDAQLKAVLVEGWPLERLDAVLRALLRAAAAELIDGAEPPARVVLDQYMEVARIFFTDKEIGFANGVLDGLARRVRPAELAAHDGRPAPQR